MMKLLSWHWKLAFRYKIPQVSLVVTALYCFIFYYFPEIPPQIIQLLIFSDPAFLGFLFIGVILLYEKSARTFLALAMSPLQAWQYIVTQTVVLTSIGLFCSFCMAYMGLGSHFDALAMGIGVSLSSVLFIMIGFISVARVKSMNQYLVVVPLLLTPLVVPLIGFLGIWDHWSLYFIPSRALLYWFTATTEPLEIWQYLYAAIYPLIWIGILLQQAKKAYRRLLNL